MAKKELKTKKPKKNSYHRVSHAHEPRSRLFRRVALYSFFTILTIFLSVLIFYRAKGYTFTKDGQVEKRGIILVDSAPVSAKILIDGKDTGKKTDYKLEVSEGEHTLRLEAEGYRSWEKSFSIKSEEVEWFYYPYLIPDNLAAKDLQSNLPIKTYSGLSSDSKVLATYKVGNGRLQNFNFELLNLKEDDPVKIVNSLLIPSQIFSRQADGSLGSIAFASWSPKGDSIYLEHTFDGKKELINLRIDSPAESANLTTNIGSDISQYRYDDKSRLYLLRSGELAIYNPKTLAKEDIIDTSILNFKNFQDNKYVYSKSSINPSKPGIEIFIRDGQNQAKKITLITAGSAGDLDFQYTTNRRTNYLSISNSANKELIIYKNPLDSDLLVTGPLFLSTFNTLKSNQIKESIQGSPQPGSYIALQLSDSSVFIYSFEDESSLTYDLPGTQAIDISWIDSERLQIKNIDGQIYYMDYDGNYKNQITTTNQPFSYFIKSNNKTIVINLSSNGQESMSQIKFKE